MTEYLKIVLILRKSEKPKIGTIECTVPDCTRIWELCGSSQGFTKAAAVSHASAHWGKYHAEHKHEGEHIFLCPLCIQVSEKECEKRTPSNYR
jgi:hypothetical protein